MTLSPEEGHAFLASNVKWLTKVAWTIKVAAALGRRRAGCVCSSSPLPKCQLQSPSLQPLVWNGARLVGVFDQHKQGVCVVRWEGFECLCATTKASAVRKRPLRLGSGVFRVIQTLPLSVIVHFYFLRFITIPLHGVYSLYMWLWDSDWVNETWDPPDNCHVQARQERDNLLTSIHTHTEKYITTHIEQIYDCSTHKNTHFNGNSSSLELPFLSALQVKNALQYISHDSNSKAVERWWRKHTYFLVQTSGIFYIISACALTQVYCIYGHSLSGTGTVTWKS